MIIPKYIQSDSCIGVTAPSGGAYKPTDKIRFENAKNKLKELSYNVIFTDNVFCDDGYGRSSDKCVRAKEFMSLIKDDTIDYIVSAKGGDYLAEMLPYLDFKKIKKNPKWVQGYSDNTSLLLAITTLCDIATIYGYNFGNYGMDEWHDSVKNNIDLVAGKNVVQNSFDMFEDGFFDKITGLEGFNFTTNVELKPARNEEEIIMSGRLLGGCLDVLVDMAGTKYENVSGYAETYKEDGILWFIESFDAVGERIIINLWKLKELGWFKNAKGFIFGRPCFYKAFSDISYEQAVMTALEELNVPIVFGADIGHKEPSWTMINGMNAEFKYKNGKATLKY
ncbi:MAG: LD-carboxypeptidase [Lachnospiraceae bacterium]|nr:LD-carboxypeptidase [Lachnospiraceae bacterium]